MHKQLLKKHTLYISRIAFIHTLSTSLNPVTYRFLEYYTSCNAIDDARRKV